MLKWVDLYRCVQKGKKMSERNVINYQELNKDIENFAKEYVSLDANLCESDSFGCRNGISYSLANNGKKKLLEISRKHSIRTVLQEQMEEFILDAAISIKNSNISTEEVLKSLNETIKESVKNNTVILPISGIELAKPFKIGTFDIYPKNLIFAITKFPNDRAKMIFEKNFENVSSLAVGTFECHPKSAKKIARSQLVFELSRLKAFIPLFANSVKYWIFPLKTDMPLSDCSYVYNDQNCISDNSIVSNIMPLELDNKRYGRESVRDFLENKVRFNQIISGNSDLWNRVHIAFEWLGKQYDEENDENKMIYSIFALECLLNSNTENFSSITAAVAEKCAYLLGANKEERVAIFNDAKSLYKIRSALVHSSNKDGVNGELVNKSYTMAIGVLFKVVDLILNERIDSLKKLDDFIINIKFKD